MRKRGSRKRDFIVSGKKKSMADENVKGFWGIMIKCRQDSNGGKSKSRTFNLRGKIGIETRN